jgi:multiple sugar transport system substrate-binding protein
VKSISQLIAGILGVFSLVASSCAPSVPAQPTAPPGPTTAPAPTPPPAGAAVEVAVTCRCVVGGVNSNTVTWLNETVFPRFREQMAAQGKQVSPRLVEFGGSDEELRAQYALDLRAGKGLDVLAFDGFWTPEFVSGGLIKPLDAIAGPEADQWEGWGHIPRTVRELLMFEGKRFGVPQGTDARGIWYRKDLFKQVGLPESWQPTSWRSRTTGTGRSYRCSATVSTATTPIRITSSW